MATSTKITALLVDWSKGDETVLNELMPLIDRELRRLARYYIRNIRPGATFQTTSLINEAYIRLVEQQSVDWKNRAHFFAIAASMMRRVLLNYIRDRNRQKRGGGAIHITLSDVSAVTAVKSKELLALDEALIRLAELDPRKAKVVELRYFGGLSVEETAEALRIAKITVIRDWNYAKAWLAREIRNDD